jgi:hypothetical protein
MTDAQVKGMLDPASGKRKPKLQRAADKAWQKKGEGL